MSGNLHWWMLPIALLALGIALVLRTRIEGNYFLFPSWHLGAGLLLIFAAGCVLVGGWIS